MKYQSMQDTRTGTGSTDMTGHEREGDGELRLILVGKSGGGKSATGNTLLGREEFESVLGANATTLQCRKAQGGWSGQRVSVVDTPDFFPLGVFRRIVYSEIRRCVELSWPGPHALVFVTQVGRFTAEDEEAATHVLDVFGVEAAQCMIVLFTRKEDLGGSSLQDYVRQSGNQALRKLAQRCGDRACAFNNRAQGAEREQQVNELMGIVQEVVRRNRGGHYTNELYSAIHLTDEKVKSFVGKNQNARRKLRVAWLLNNRCGFIILGLLFFIILIVILAVVLNQA